MDVGLGVGAWAPLVQKFWWHGPRETCSNHFHFSLNSCTKIDHNRPLCQKSQRENKIKFFEIEQINLAYREKKVFLASRCVVSACRSGKQKCLKIKNKRMQPKDSVEYIY